MVRAIHESHRRVEEGCTVGSLPSYANPLSSLGRSSEQNEGTERTIFTQNEIFLFTGVLRVGIEQVWRRVKVASPGGRTVDYGIGCYRARVELCSVLEYMNPSIIIIR